MHYGSGFFWTRSVVFYSLIPRFKFINWVWR